MPTTIPIAITGNTHVEVSGAGIASNFAPGGYYAFLVQVDVSGANLSPVMRSVEMKFTVSNPTDQVTLFFPGGARSSQATWYLYIGARLRNEDSYIPLTIGTFGVTSVVLDASTAVPGLVTEFIPDLVPTYYLGLLTSQYRTLPNFNAWLRSALELLAGVMDVNAAMVNAFDIDYAAGAQLDIIGQIVGVTRVLPFQPTGSQPIAAINKDAGGTGYMTGNILTVSAGNNDATVKVTIAAPLTGAVLAIQLLNPGTGYSVASNVPTMTSGGFGGGCTVDITAISSTIPPTLDDDHYRILIKSKIARNQWDGQFGSLFAIWQNLFPGGLITVQDNQNMTATVLCIGSFDSLVKDMILHNLIVPRPEGVQYNFVFPTLPIFGFDGDGVFIAGFDTGHWA